jgi:hypothetical protein
MGALRIGRKIRGHTFPGLAFRNCATCATLLGELPVTIAVR